VDYDLEQDRRGKMAATNLRAADESASEEPVAEVAAGDDAERAGDQQAE
jgi:hypothetical protein